MFVNVITTMIRWNKLIIKSSVVGIGRIAANDFGIGMSEVGVKRCSSDHHSYSISYNLLNIGVTATEYMTLHSIFEI
jgi:hypothetical protein